MPKHKLPFKEFIWSADLAYIIGLLVTDGCLSKDGRHIAMRSSDYQLLETFRTCLNLTNSITQTKHDSWAKRPAYKLQFGSVQFYNWLLTIGLFPAKTYTVGPLQIPDKYFYDFLRGHLDGDGSVWTYTDMHNTLKNPKYIYTRLFMRFISASRIHVEWIRGTITRLLNVKGHMYENKPLRAYQTTSIWEVKFAKKESITLLRHLYYNDSVPCLERKRFIVRSVLKKISKEKRRPYVFLNKVTC